MELKLNCPGPISTGSKLSGRYGVKLYVGQIRTIWGQTIRGPNWPANLGPNCPDATYNTIRSVFCNTSEAMQKTAS